MILNFKNQFRTTDWASQPIHIDIDTKNGTGQIFKPIPVEEDTMDEEMSTGI